MASTIMHMAVTEVIVERLHLKNKNRIMLGVILPDIYEKESTRNDSHLKITIYGGKKDTYHLTNYRKTYGNLMMKDELYLGYYLHLIQDIVYRDFLYKKYHWNPCIPGNVERLHKDYRLINSYVIEKYKLQNNIILPDDFSKEPINELCSFGVQHLYKDLELDFTIDTEGDIFFFTKEMADLYIDEACDLCQKEIVALIEGKTCIDEYKWAWNRVLKSLLETTSNTRELGGYKTGHGRYTLCNRLIRSDEQKTLSKRDITYLLDKKITTIIDMRGNENIRKVPSPFVEMSQFYYYNIPIEEGSNIPKSTYEVPISYMKIADSKNINQVFKRMAHARDNVLFHCAAGKDRTGVVSAILLMLVNVSDEDIIENYMITRECNQKRFALASRNFPDIDINIIIPNIEYINKFLSLFRKKYGDAEKYLLSIGVLPEEIQLLKDRLLK